MIRKMLVVLCLKCHYTATNHGTQQLEHCHLLLLQVRKTLRDSVKDIIHQVGVTSILVTHDQEEAFDIADKVVIFNRQVVDHML